MLLMNLDLFVQLGLACAALLYSLIVSGFIVGLLKIRYVSSQEKPFVSVIVAARNEEANLKVLLPALLQQNYPAYEVIVANDRSTDDTGDVVRDHQRKVQNLRIVDITSRSADMPAKKNALSEAIKLSKGEILCFTDADCVPPKQWISELVAAFEPQIGLAAGYSPYDESLAKSAGDRIAQKLFHKFISYEELKAAAWSGGAIGLNKGWLCTGRNLAYRKRVYDEVGGFEELKHSVSGDDDLFLQLVRRNTKWGMRYVTSPASFVRTSPPESLRDFVEQRRRHFSAGKFFPFSMKLFFFFFHLSNLLIFLGFLGFLLGLPELALGLPTFAVKLAADVTLFLLVSEMLSQKGFASYFLLMEDRKSVV